ncbi:chaplin [Streptomyces sp. SBT349]|uniref:chaplin n=1 Tax=Streptomyces sp. SBT349 TaxID=1580539 RepID=UPI00066E075F
MNKTRTFLLAAGLSVTLAGVGAGTAAADGEDGKDGRDGKDDRGHSAPRGCVNIGDSHAEAAAVGSPGVLSGNVIQIPVHVPINLCGNSVNVIGFLNPAFGN